MQPKEHDIISMNEENYCNEKSKDIPEEVTLKLPIEVHIERILTDQNIESTKDEMLEADANLEEMNVTVHQGRRKVLALHYGYTVRVGKHNSNYCWQVFAKKTLKFSMLLMFYISILNKHQVYFF